jgi:hypothetical protein
VDALAASGERREVDGAVLYTRRPPREPALRDDGATAWLEHRLYAPLDQRGLARLEHERRAPLPPVLRRLYTECGNGASLLSGDVEVYGHRTAAPWNPHELAIQTLDLPRGMPAGAVAFGSWGSERNVLYLDGDQRVHLSGLRSAIPLRTWRDLGVFLSAALDEGLACWDMDGRRIADLPVPEETARPPALAEVELRVPTGLEDRAAEVRELLAAAGPQARAAGATWTLAEPSALGAAQQGHGGDDWSETWLVIGHDEDLGDPLFVDLADEGLPVFTAMHGQGVWEPEQVVPSLRALLG